jgi:hypothetical protein
MSNTWQAWTHRSHSKHADHLRTPYLASDPASPTLTHWHNPRFSPCRISPRHARRPPRPVSKRRAWQYPTDHLPVISPPRLLSHSLSLIHTSTSSPSDAPRPSLPSPHSLHACLRPQPRRDHLATSSSAQAAPRLTVCSYELPYLPRC